jgi:peptidoglycan/xylan/chitin deacetylase (PgdA/CDA1 family)
MKTFLSNLKSKESRAGISAIPFRGYVRDEKVRIRNFLFRSLCQSKMVGAWQFLFQRNRPSIVLYHDPDPQLFAAHIDEFKKYFNIISLRDYVVARTNNTVHLLPKYSLIITIDDGLVGNYKLRDAIARRRVPVTIFLTSGVVNTNRHFWWTYVRSEEDFRRMKKKKNKEVAAELLRFNFDKAAPYSTRQALNAPEIREMAPYVDFQAHTRFHPVLPTCTAEEADDEICGCKSELEARFSLDIYALAFPHGDYCDRDIALAKQAGYRCAVTVDGGLNGKSTDLFRLKRIYMPDDAGPLEAVVKASGLWTVLMRPFKPAGPRY